MPPEALAKDRGLVQREIEDAFLDTPFGGRITSADGRPDKELDEERELYAELHGKKWSEIPKTFINSHPDGVVLLVDDAYSAFLPAWLISALTDDKVRELMVYHFSPKEPSTRSRRRIQRLASKQREAILAFLTYCVHVETGLIKEGARTAVAFVKSAGVE